MSEDNIGRWYDLYDKAYQKALEDGHFDNLPGAGKPLDLKADDDVPDAMRYAFKIMRENDIAPEWIMSGKALENQHRKLVNRIDMTVKRYAGMIADAERVPAKNRTMYRRNAREKFDSDKRKLEKAVEGFNKDVLAYNLKVPSGVTHRRFFDLSLALSKALSMHNLTA